jgi:hypothetical protein
MKKLFHKDIMEVKVIFKIKLILNTLISYNKSFFKMTSFLFLIILHHYVFR